MCESVWVWLWVDVQAITKLVQMTKDRGWQWGLNERACLDLTGNLSSSQSPNVILSQSVARLYRVALHGTIWNSPGFH